MNAYEAYIKYLAIKQHFTIDGYDYFKYNGKVNASVNAFEVRKDKYFFHKLSKRDDLEGFLVCNMLEDTNRWVGDLLSDKGEEAYSAYKKRKESLSYLFKEELSKLNEDLNSNFECVDGQQPFIVKQYNRKNLSLDTLVIVNDVLRFSKYIDKNCQDTILWPAIKKRMDKYKPFMSYDKVKMKKILKEKFYATT